MAPALTPKAAERERDDRRLAAQLLVGPPAGGVSQVVERLLAVQAQDLRAARLAIRCRILGLTAADVDRGRVKLDLFGHLPTQVLADLEREARDVERFVAPH